MGTGPVQDHTSCLVESFYRRLLGQDRYSDDVKWCRETFEGHFIEGYHGYGILISTQQGSDEAHLLAGDVAGAAVVTPLQDATGGIHGFSHSEMIQ